MTTFTNPRVKHFISLRDYTDKELINLLDRADELKRAWQENAMPRSLWNKRVALWFYGNVFRNRVAFELGAEAMGATVSFVPGELGVHEPIEDISGYLGNWFSMLIFRAKHHKDLLTIASNSPIPVINARTDRSHPCEILGDLQYVRQHRGKLEGLRLVFVGEPTNLCMSWIEAATVFPIKVTHVCPPGYEISYDILGPLQNGAKGEIDVTSALLSPLKNADVLYTDCWPHTEPGQEREKIESDFLPYQINLSHLAILGERGIFLPCPPVNRGQEVSAEAMNSPKCKNREAKDNLLHIQNAIMEFMVRE
jgi:ornithine carbamoyltransferase